MIGVSPHTHEKQAQLRMILPMYFRIMRGAMRNRLLGPVAPAIRIWDLHAGNGYPDGHPGSPIIFAEEATKTPGPWVLYAFERDRKAIPRLRESLAPWPQAEVVPGDHHVTISHVITRVRRPHLRQFGFVYMDPNNDHISVCVARYITAGLEGQQTDILLHVSATARKRVRALGRRHLEEDLHELDKKHILVYPFKGPWRWTMFLCTNWDKAAAPQGWIPLNTPAGRRIMDRLNLTEEEWLEQYQTKFDLPTDPTANISGIRSTEPSAPELALGLADGASGATNAE